MNRKSPIIPDAAVEREKPDAPMYAPNVLRTAADLVGGTRRKTHGQAEHCFDTIASFMSVYLHASGKLPEHKQLTAEDAAWFCMLLKLSRRVAGRGVADHFIDAAGYVGLAGEMYGLELDKELDKEAD